MKMMNYEYFESLVTDLRVCSYYHGVMSDQSSYNEMIDCEDKLLLEIKKLLDKANEA